ncbi:WD40 repeat-like protein [Auriscalpium vulgare]|uniref:WD40 repeat-like protein n=1 Tax=Auriscalpium vulgare TaxID=40419 RepID=A0ACB8S8Z0_9AGAM|nr:WD40 repeat-like protein [Auriscalpium vulgare]
MRARHLAHSVPAFPVYSAAFLSEGELVLGGGGGASKTGIKNKLRLYHVDEFLTMKLADELELESGEDAPMSMAAHPDGRTFVCGVNSPADKVSKGENLNCRVYTLDSNDEIELVSATGTLGRDIEDYQKVTVLSPDGGYLAVAGTRQMSILTFPALAPATTRIERGEIYDMAFTVNSLVVATTINLLIYNLSESQASPKEGKGKERPSSSIVLETPRTLELPKLPGGEKGIFRVARFHPLDPRIFYTVINTTPARGVKSPTRKAYIARWNAETWKVDRIRKIGDKGLTTFDMSDNGKWIAYGSSDCSVGLLDAYTLAPLLSILKSHEFPSTVLKFNPGSRLLISGSADNTVRLISIPDGLGDSSWSSTLPIVLALFFILFALAVQMFMSGAI